MEKQKNNSDKQKNSQWIWPGLISVVVLGSIIMPVFLESILNLSSDVLLQFIFLAIGCGVSYWVGQQSVKKAAKEIIKPHARSAFRRLIFLYLTLRHAANIIESSQSSGAREEYHVVLARLEEIVTAQLLTADDALADWDDIVPEDVKELKQKLQSQDSMEDGQ